MIHPRGHRILTLLLAAIILLWPVVPPSAMTANAAETRVNAATATSCPGCDRGMVRGSCAVTPCAVPPALLPASLPELAAAGGIAFTPVNERGRGHTPGIQTPPPRA